MKRIAIAFVLTVLCIQFSYTQCDTGSEPECTCETAEVLCSVSELDGYSSSMSSFQHPDDGPTPFCGGQTQTNNPTWFAFIAWCSDITMEVSFENCSTVNNTEGAQLAVYTDCSFNDQVDCDSQCSDDSTVSLDLGGLTIGESYYVMLDGCFGSACDYSISVSPTDCDEFIEDWEEPVTEQEVVCIGNTVIYEVDNLDGATTWHWYLDGNLLDETDFPSYTIDWDTEGIYELCVDVSNICLDESEAPEPNCVTITVGDPEAGEILDDNSPECPGEFIDLMVVGYNENALYTEALIVVNSVGEVVAVSENDPDIGFTWLNCGTFTVYSLNFPEGVDIEVPELEDEYLGSDCVMNCCDETSITIVFEDFDDPSFDVYPMDVTVSCYHELVELELDETPILEASDNCLEDSEVAPTEQFMVDTCNGGVITREWFFQDSCGNSVFHSQTITVGAWTPPVFIDPPSDTSMTSLGYESYTIQDLNYNNGQGGTCSISGAVQPIIEDNRNGCAGHVLVQYSFIDSCAREIVATQRIDIITDVVAQDTSLLFCDADMTGVVTINQSDLDSLIADDPTNVTIGYYLTEADLDARH